MDKDLLTSVRNVGWKGENRKTRFQEEITKLQTVWEFKMEKPSIVSFCLSSDERLLILSAEELDCDPPVMSHRGKAGLNGACLCRPKKDFSSVFCYCSIFGSMGFPVRYPTPFIVATNVRVSSFSI